ncbi:MAG: hypothetical protein JW818_15435 [Pirellulales bacterium]|nr:hypothetical protein [Pirellulales bacterium]
MSNTSNSTLHPVEILRLLGVYRRRWLIPAAVITLGAMVFALFGPVTWQASQALIVRNDAVNSQGEPGQFSHSDQMKAVQETMLEVVRSRGVLEAALVEVGPPASYTGASAAWPSDRDVAELREAVELTPPKGAEFGSTEVFYLSVKSHDRHRALDLAGAVCDQLEVRSRELRDARAKSMMDELVKAVALAQTDLEASTGQVAAIEKKVGPDLVELRILNDGMTGDSAMARTNTEIRGELRQAETTQQTNRQLLRLLRDAQNDPKRLMALPNSLLQRQPALSRLKDGLVDAQLRMAELEGRMQDAHPTIQAARESLRKIAEDLHNEIAQAIAGLEVDVRLENNRVSMLEDRLTETADRMEKLAELRAPYANLVAQTRHRAELVEQAERNLAQARAAQAGASAASLISRIDTPDTGTKPIGPGRTMIVLMGLAGGLFTGLGILLLTVTPGAETISTTPATTHETPIDVAPPAEHRVPTFVGKAQPTFDAATANLSLTEALQKLAATTPVNQD